MIAMIFILQIIIYPVALRFLMRFHQVEYYNPLTQSILQLTNKPLKFFQKFCQTTKKIDTPALLCTYLLCLGLLTLKAVLLAKSLSAFSLAALGALEVLNTFCSLYFIASLIYAISSFFGLYNAKIKIFLQLISEQIQKIETMFPKLRQGPMNWSFTLWFFLLIVVDYIIGLSMIRL
jgi:YggT family protein